ncbi:MAG: putative GntR family transcriptional regulator [Evtepia sp.]|jgi:DNA-binding transcriptional regulator YhcF (GntR family)|nr:putative GntR family transcriptional regulator [Evtepia sp.]
MTWSFQNDTPIYAQLIHTMKQQIVAGVYATGEKLPSVRDLAAEAGVNPNTMQRALTELEREGLMYSQRTAGRFVTEDRNMIEAAKKALAEEQVKRFLTAMTGLGYEISDIIALLEQEENKGDVSCQQS